MIPATRLLYHICLPPPPGSYAQIFRKMEQFEREMENFTLGLDILSAMTGFARRIAAYW